MSITWRDVEEVQWSQVPLHFQGSEIFSSDELMNEFRQWRKDHKVYLYSRPREDFFPSEGLRLAAAAGFSKVLMEDLS